MRLSASFHSFKSWSLLFTILAMLTVATSPALGQSAGCQASENACVNDVNGRFGECVDAADQGFIQGGIAFCFSMRNAGISTCQNALSQCSNMYVYPAFRIMSTLYVPPGNQSSVAYSTTVASGTQTSDSSSFTKSTQEGAGFKIAGFSLGTTFTLTNVNTTASSDQVTAQNAGTTTFKSTSDPIDHSHDVLTIWTNPQITVSNFPIAAYQFAQSTGNAQYNPATGSPMPDAPSDATSLITISVGQLQNPSTIPAGALVSQTLDGAVVSGLLKLCANRIPENQCTVQQAAANGCGCQASDFAAVIQSDPFFDPAVLARNPSPGVVDVNALDPDNARFVPVLDSNGASLLMTLAGPGSGSTSSQTQTVTDTHNTSKTYTHTLTKQIGVTFGFSSNAPKADPTAFTWNLSSGNNITWSDTKSSGTTSSNAHSQTVTLGTSSPACFTNIAVYEDTDFHTFAFQSTSNVQNPCP